MSTVIKNVRLQDGVFDVKLKDGKIERIAKAGKFRKYDIDGTGLYLVPGFIDVHIHGFKGIDSADCEFYKIGNALADEGTTSWVATLMTDTPDNLEKITHSTADKGKANFLGYHLEGPYLSLKKSGAQNKDYIKSPDLNEFARFKDVKMVTIAPEIDGAMEFIEKCGVICCIGHTDCDCDTALKAIEKGANCLTHTFNAMPPMLHRAPGPIGAAVEKNIYAQLICDGRHVAKQVVLAAYKMFTSDRLVLISDMIRPAGMPDGVYDSGGYDVYLKEGVATLKDGVLAGGSFSLKDAVKTAVSFGIDFYEAIKMTTETPATLLGIEDRKGRIAEGYDADLVLLDSNLDVVKTFVNGEIVFSK